MNGAAERSADAAMTEMVIPLVLRGEIVDEELRAYEMRGDGSRFLAADIGKYVRRLPTSPASLRDLYAIGLDDIVAFMAEVGSALYLEKNPHMRQAFEMSARTSGLSASILETLYQRLPASFDRDAINRFVEAQIGRDYLEGWVETDLGGGRKMSVRAFGARAVHIIAGNSPGVAFLTILRSALTRSDSIIKLPSNDPMTAVAILRTMIEIAPDHPVTRHLSAAYWKGGDEQIESALYQPRNIEKIVAWGGFASITHITKYLQPGIDLITLDPKQSGSIVGAEGLSDDASIADVATRAARDIGAFNQELCANARVIYVVCDDQDEEQMARLNRLAAAIVAALQELPGALSTRAKAANPALQGELAGIALQDDFYTLHKTDDDLAGAVIVSHFDEPVEFATMLANRTANLVPVPSVEDALKRIDAASQTVGVYPDALKAEIRDALAIQGAQHIVSLGKVTEIGSLGPQDGLQVERRMLKWIRDMTV